MSIALKVLPGTFPEEAPPFFEVSPTPLSGDATQVLVRETRVMRRGGVGSNVLAPVAHANSTSALLTGAARMVRVRRPVDQSMSLKPDGQPEVGSKPICDDFLSILMGGPCLSSLFSF